MMDVLIWIYAISTVAVIALLWEIDRDARKQQRRRETLEAADKVALLDAELDAEAKALSAPAPVAWLEHGNAECCGDWELRGHGTRYLFCPECLACQHGTSENRVLAVAARTEGMRLKRFAEEIAKAELEGHSWES